MPVWILARVVLVLSELSNSGDRIYDTHLIACNPSTHCFIVSAENFFCGSVIAQQAITHDNAAFVGVVILFGVV